MRKPTADEIKTLTDLQFALEYAQGQFRLKWIEQRRKYSLPHKFRIDSTGAFVVDGQSLSTKKCLPEEKIWIDDLAENLEYAKQSLIVEAAELCKRCGVVISSRFENGVWIDANGNITIPDKKESTDENEPANPRAANATD
jgi:hypothetical protein